MAPNKQTMDAAPITKHRTIAIRHPRQAWNIATQTCTYACRHSDPTTPLYRDDCVKLLPLPQPPVRARTDARTNPSAQRATQLMSVLARVYDVSIQNQITTTVP
jgi:hypothetical protein